jgi:hypothetical protein
MVQHHHSLALELHSLAKVPHIQVLQAHHSQVLRALHNQEQLAELLLQLDR